MESFVNFFENKELGLSKITEKGIKFETGVPVEFEFIRNTQKSPNLGSTYGQDIEPAGLYMLHNTHNNEPEQKERLNKQGWQTGLAKFDNPLVIELSKDYDNSGSPQNIYGEKGWKQRLFDVYKKKGKELTDFLLSRGYDGIVTTSGYDTREIIDLTFGKKIKYDQ